MIGKNPEDILAIMLLTSILIACFTYFIVNWNIIVNHYLPPILLLTVVGLCGFSAVTIIQQIKKRVERRDYRIVTIVSGTIIAVIGFAFAFSEEKHNIHPASPALKRFPNLVTGTIIVLVGTICVMIGHYFSKIHILISRDRVERRYFPVVS